MFLLHPPVIMPHVLLRLQQSVDFCTVLFIVQHRTFIQLREEVISLTPVPEIGFVYIVRHIYLFTGVFHFMGDNKRRGDEINQLALLTLSMTILLF